MTSQFNITSQPTKNENILKFIANSFLVHAESYEFKNIDEAKISPLAQQLFHLPFVKTVYIAQNFVAIEKYNIVQWEEVEDAVASAISEYLNSGNPVITKTDSMGKIPISIYAESTPNPLVMKFVANKPLVTGNFEFKNVANTSISPLAATLFNFPFVKEVFLSSNYISIMKLEALEWNDIVVELRDFLKKYFEDGKPILTDEALTDKAQTSNTVASQKITTPQTDIEKEIVSILNEFVAPAVAGDGGHIAFDSFHEESKTVRVILQGACSGCPSSTITLKNGIETMLREMMQGRVSHVEAVNG
jgi:NFU1 iron-sulfur cluster scaffold homolog, mitochondrial